MVAIYQKTIICLSYKPANSKTSSPDREISTQAVIWSPCPPLNCNLKKLMERLLNVFSQNVDAREEEEEDKKKKKKKKKRAAEVKPTFFER
jgi:hypothetical protein